MTFELKQLCTVVALCVAATATAALAADTTTDAAAKSTRKAARSAANATNASNQPAAAPKAAEVDPQSQRAGGVKRGRYLTIVGGCNDCHTAGYAPSAGQVPEAQWLLGDGTVGFRGPWGTTYAPNLRRVVAKMNEDEWVKYAKDLKTRPPMPWFTLKQWVEVDLRALYRYIRQLGPAGDATTAFVPPDATPKGMVIQWPAPPK
jgi:mono/diheme cytochrome c family protein